MQSHLAQRYKIENYVGRTFLNSKLCNKLLRYLLIIVHELKLKLGVYFAKKVGFFFLESGYLTYIYLLPKKWGVSEGHI